LKPAEIPRNCASSNSTKRPKAIVIDSDDNMNPFDVNQGPWAQASLIDLNFNNVTEINNSMHGKIGANPF
jgi:hypothetical protein